MQIKRFIYINPKNKCVFVCFLVLQQFRCKQITKIIIYPKKIEKKSFFFSNKANANWDCCDFAMANGNRRKRIVNKLFHTAAAKVLKMVSKSHKFIFFGKNVANHPSNENVNDCGVSAKAYMWTGSNSNSNSNSSNEKKGKKSQTKLRTNKQTNEKIERYRLHLIKWKTYARLG